MMTNTAFQYEDKKLFIFITNTPYSKYQLKMKCK